MAHHADTSVGSISRHRRTWVTCAKTQEVCAIWARTPGRLRLRVYLKGESLEHPRRDNRLVWRTGPEASKLQVPNARGQQMPPVKLESDPSIQHPRALPFDMGPPIALNGSCMAFAGHDFLNGLIA